MIDRLNIPLKSGTTTRRKRWVVWEVVMFLILALFIFTIFRLFFFRSRFSVAATEQSLVIDVVGSKAILELERHIGMLPLIPDRAITLRTIAPYVSQEIAVFQDFNSKQRFILINKPIRNKDVSTYESYGLRVVNFENYSVLGSDSVLESYIKERFSGLDTRQMHLRSALPWFDGLALIGGKKMTISIDSTGIFFRQLNAFRVAKGLNLRPDNMLAQAKFTADLFLTEEYLSRFLPKEIIKVVQPLINGNSGTILITGDKDGVGYRLDIDRSINSDILAQITKKSALLQVPITILYELPDSSFVEEIRTNPAFVRTKIEEAENWVEVRAETEQGLVVARKTDEKTVISNRQDLLEQENWNNEVKTECVGKTENLFFVQKIGELLSRVQTKSIKERQFFDVISIFGFKDTGFSICW